MWKRRAVDLARALSAQSLSVNSLVDMEWKFGVTASSDEMEQVGATFLQLRMCINKGEGGAPEVVTMEMTLPQFYAFLSTMEQAKSHLDYLVD